MWSYLPRVIFRKQEILNEKCSSQFHVLYRVPGKFPVCWIFQKGNDLLCTVTDTEDIQRITLAELQVGYMLSYKWS
jgi:hypothetical protein